MRGTQQAFKEPWVPTVPERHVGGLGMGRSVLRMSLNGSRWPGKEVPRAPLALGDPLPYHHERGGPPAGQVSLQVELHQQRHTHAFFWINPYSGIFPVLLTSACKSLWQLRKQCRGRKTIREQRNVFLA